MKSLYDDFVCDALVTEGNAKAYSISSIIRPLSTVMIRRRIRYYRKIRRRTELPIQRSLIFYGGDL